MTTSSRRTLVQALAVSLLLHVVLLSSAVSLFPARLAAPATPLSAVIGERGAAVPAAGASPSQSASATAKPPPRAAAPRLAAASPATPAEAPVSAAANDHSSPASSGATGRSAAPAASGVAASASSLNAASTAVANASSGAAPAAAHQGLSGDDLRQYRLSLASAARRFKRYPALASQRGWEGTVELALKVSALTPLPEVVLVRSSGHLVLDEQAVDMLTQAARVTALPEGLKARDFRIVLPVQFSLENDQ